MKRRQENNDHTKILDELTSHLTEHFKLTEEEKKQLKPSGGQTLFQNRVGWARFNLKKTGLISVLSDKTTIITQEGTAG